ncbi:hypothetical protein KFK09_003022 [Dendrobium nobile]|uniref:Uncharacterized protein n=1 Tax=Dendrobium nobile TaxID=94219 RepID=A0A8T3C8I7_DENNO|nr:hypothetical protein KFK09_003022 [Dendrobium nobile]
MLLIKNLSCGGMEIVGQGGFESTVVREVANPSMSGKEENKNANTLETRERGGDRTRADEGKEKRPDLGFLLL